MSLTAGPVRPAISGVSVLPGPAPTTPNDSSTLQSRRRINLVTTPGLVVGRTVLNGAIPYALLRRIAEDEASMPDPVC